MQVRMKKAQAGQRVTQWHWICQTLIKDAACLTSTPHISTLEKWSVRFLLWPAMCRHMTTPCFTYACTYCKLMHPFPTRCTTYPILEFLNSRFSVTSLLLFKTTVISTCSSELSYTAWGNVLLNQASQHSFITTSSLQRCQAKACL